METRYYEGCGREGPIRCIFLCEFHPVAGPKITCQFPDEYVSKEVFDAISVYIIPKPQLQKKIMTINALGHKIVGYPIRIDNQRYERNAYLFNLCFVCDSWSKTVQYEPVVKKLAEHLTIMEEETRFMSSGSTRLPTLLAHLLHDLNTYRKATVVEGDTVMHLKVLEVRKDPPIVEDHDVPVFLSAFGTPRPGRPPRTPPPVRASPDASTRDPDREEAEPVSIDEGAWDLTTRQLIPYIDGCNHIAKISTEADVEKTLVKACIQNLVYYGAVVLVPVLKFSNVYRATPTMSRLFRDTELQKACLAFCSEEGEDGAASLHDALGFLCAMQQGVSLRAVCERRAGPRRLDARRLVLFALVHGLVRCLRQYPVYVGPPLAPCATPRVRRLLDGRHCIDQICCEARLPLPALEKIIEDDPDVAIIWR